jgi:WD40 repeat protein
VSDIQFVPKNVRVDKRTGVDGKQHFFMSCCEDGFIHIWDTRAVTVEELSKHVKKFEWTPFLTVNLYRQDGSGEVGLSKVLFSANQENPVFYGASDEGDLLLIDWSIKPVGDDTKIAENIRLARDSERNYRPIVALERSPFYEDLIMTVHDFHFAIWKTSIDTQETPIYRSANTFNSHNTCGAFSPTRPGVIFITKTDGIDVWDFLDQSNKPSLTYVATSPITYFRFQIMKDKKKKSKQYMAYGDQTEGTLYLTAVAHNLAHSASEGEREAINEFWNTEIRKCDYVKARRVTMKEDF